MRLSLASTCVLFLTHATACGARTEGLFDRGDAAPPVDAPAAVDAPRLDGGPVPLCEGLTGFGEIQGFVPPMMFYFPYIAVGVEPSTTHSCPRFFLRAGDAPDFSGDTLDIEVPYDVSGPFEPGIRTGHMTVRFRGMEWIEEILIDVQRADGLFETTLPIDEWRGSATLDYHDATTDLTATIVDAPYRPCFAICI